MDVIILTGGRGRRLGALTLHQPKANLHFAGKSLLMHTFSALEGSEHLIQHVYVATGYMAESVETQYRHEAIKASSKIPVTFLPFEPELSGTFGSVIWALRAATMVNTCLVIGIDVIITQRAMSELIASIRDDAPTTFLVSPLLTIAPTHGHIRLSQSSAMLEYRKYSMHAKKSSWHSWYSDVGIRYFSADFVEECRSLSLTGACDFDDIIPSLVNKGRIFNTHMLNERWLHFAGSRDFSQKPL